jgi:hypothetical protein
LNIKIHGIVLGKRPRTEPDIIPASFEIRYPSRFCDGINTSDGAYHEVWATKTIPMCRECFEYAVHQSLKTGVLDMTDAKIPEWKQAFEKASSSPVGADVITDTSRRQSPQPS